MSRSRETRASAWVIACLHGTVSSDRALVLKTQVSSNAIQIPGHNLNVVCVILSTRNMSQSRKRHPAQTNCAGIHNHIRAHTPNIYRSPGLTACVMKHTPTSEMTAFHPVSGDAQSVTSHSAQAATLPAPIPTGKYPVPFKVKRHIYCGIFMYF